MLLCTQFSEQLKLVSLDMNEKSFEFEPKELAVSEYFNGCYIDAYISKKYNNNPFVIRLFFFDFISSECYSYFFIIKNNKLVNFEIPWDSPDFEKITKDSGTYYKVKGSFSFLLKDKLLNEIIAKNNLATTDVPAFDSIDMKSLKMTLKFKLESGSIVTYRSRCKGTLSEKSTILVLVKNMQGHDVNKDQVKDRVVNKDQVKDRVVNKDQVKDRVVNKEQVKDRVVNKEQLKNRVVSKEQVKDSVVSEQQLKDSDVSEDQVKDSVVSEDQVKDSVVSEERNAMASEIFVINILINGMEGAMKTVESAEKEIEELKMGLTEEEHQIFDREIMQQKITTSSEARGLI
ncbi:uncharacterized protein BdWA1_003858 [Babesia duncani]|uniref:Uncharacterized protein n=1 Tax=Babesia duncani TaxID=323732 RepID=A0AAD9PGZ2_9APIC|nr:hypothetical protein BdWA1_003858 [Babesia duncani]